VGTEWILKGDTLAQLIGAATGPIDDLERARLRLLDGEPLGDATQRIGVPLYIFPDYASTPSVWETIAVTAPASRFVIANPNTGPGASSDSFYVTQLQRMRASGVLTLGYVSTSYATVAIDTVMSDVGKWRSWYGVDGIFLDETAYNSDQAHYQQIYNSIKALDSDLIVVSNPGLGVDESMSPTSDIFMSFEGDPTAYRARPGVAAPAWERTAPAWRFWHLVHSVTSLAEANEMLDLSRTYRAGTVFVTDRTMPNPWLGLPVISGIWEAQLARTRPQGRARLWGYSAAPAVGTWKVGDIVLNNAPTAGGTIGWVCTTAGTPGTWKTWGAISA
jgi:hypothetical protein